MFCSLSAQNSSGSSESLRASSFSEVVSYDERKSSSNPNLTGDGKSGKKSKSARALTKLTKAFTRKKNEEDMETGL